MLILWKSFSKAVQEEYKKAVEKNKPILIFIKHCKYNEQRTPELEKFITDFSVEQNEHIITSYTHFRKLSELKEEVKRALAAEIGKFYEEPICTLSKEEMYNLGTDIIKYAQKRLIIHQRTPTLFLGTKDRMKSNQYAKSFQSYEKKFETELIQWIEKYKDIPDTEFTYLFDAEASKKELQENFPTEEKEEKLKNIEDDFKKYKKN